MSLPIRIKPLTELQALVVRLKEAEELGFDEIARQVGITKSWARVVYAGAMERLADFARHGEDSLLLLPKRARMALEFYQIKSRAEFRAATESGQLRWVANAGALCHEKRGTRACGVKTWAALEEWAGLSSPEPAEKRVES